MASEREEKVTEYIPCHVTKRSYWLSLWAGSGVVLGSLYFAYKYGSFIPVPSETTNVAVRMGYACKCLALPCLSPLVSIAECIGGRVRSKVWPMTGRDHLLPQLEKNVLMNTIEQFGLFAVSLLALGSSLHTPEQLRLIPTLCILFIIGRITFRLGYPDNRAFGFTINYAISIFNVGAVVYLVFRNGLLSGLDN